MSAKPDKHKLIVLNHIDQAFEKRAWHGTTLKGSLRGMQVDMAVWKPSPTRRSIWEYLLHAAYWKNEARRIITRDKSIPFERVPRDWPRLPEERTPKTLKKDIDYLKKEHRLYRALIEELPSERLVEARPPKGPSLLDIVQGVANHDLYHTGQIQLLKRLYRESHGT